MNGLRIAMVGTRGVPARYGGFETAIEEIGQRLCARGHQVTVYCRDTGAGPRPDSTYLGMDLVFLPAMHKRSLETLSHTGLSVMHLMAHRPDAAIVFNAANAPYLPLIRAAGVPVATHVDGLEWKRAKWGGSGKRYYRRAEAMAVRWSDALIADAVGIQTYYRERFDADTYYLPYGAPILAGTKSDKLAELGLKPRGYHLVVARFEPENHVHMVVDGYVRSKAKEPLIVVGSAPYSDAYTRQVHSLADDRVRFVGGVWDQDLLDQLYANSLVYWHGHSVGGTNPSLLRAIGSGAATNAFDVDFNREVLSTAGRYFADPAGVAALAEEAESGLPGLRERGVLGQRLARRFDWDLVTDGYEGLCADLVAATAPAPRRARRVQRGTQQTTVGAE
ncbi:glycosyl transferase [Arthrobacter sp. Leaf141]|nr:glycosyl transferase [Arthrobacter sp. Leaf141]